MSILSDEWLAYHGPDLIQPFLPGSVQPASIDVHLDSEFFRMRNCLANVGTPVPMDVSAFEDPDNWFEKDPVKVARGGHLRLLGSEFVLASTFEKVTIPHNMVARFEGKSSLGRNGLLTHATAGFIDPGFSGHITLEIKNLHPRNSWLLVPGMKIGQICFELMTGRARRPYGHKDNGSHYQGQRGPVKSRSHIDFSTIDVYGKEQ